jgi:arabinogalactan oligomer/maltooligosaccharide transport system substrate-binding protein
MMAFAGSKAIGVNPYCEDQEVAVALAAYLGSEEAQIAHYEMRNVIPANSKAASNDKVATDVVAVAQNATISETSILQPTVPNMGRYWGPAESMGKELVAKTVNHDNAEAKTVELNESLNKDAVE